MQMPDTRGWIILGLFALTGFIFSILAANLTMSDMRQLFTVLSTAVVSGGLGGAVGFYFGSSKSSDQKTDTIANLAANQSVPTTNTANLAATK